jgi:hypothetical protein
VNGIEYLLTWNYKHLANAGVRNKIETTCRELGYEAVIICTPEELMEVSAMWEDPIVAEVRRVRVAHAAQFNNDLLAIYRDLKAEEQKSGRQFASYPARRVAAMKRPPGESWTQQLTSLAGQAAAIGMVRRHGRRASLSWPLASLRGLQRVSLLQASTASGRLLWTAFPFAMWPTSMAGCRSHLTGRTFAI